MRTPELETISIFSRDIFLNLTINQISKELNKSYAFTNKYIRSFLDEGILTKKVVGSAILCSLNFSNEKTLGLLMLDSINKKTAFLQKADKKILETLKELKKTPGLKSLFIVKDNAHIICEDKLSAQAYLDNFFKKQGKGMKVRLIEDNEFKLTYREIDFENTTIVEGYERFWKLIAEIVS